MEGQPQSQPRKSVVTFKFSPAIKLTNTSNHVFQFPKFRFDILQAANQRTSAFLSNAILNFSMSLKHRENELRCSWISVGDVLREKATDCKGWLWPRTGTAPCFASVSAPEAATEVSAPEAATELSAPEVATEVPGIARMSPEKVVKAFKEVPVYAVSNPSNEFMLISDPNSSKSLCMLFFNEENAQCLLEQIKRSIRGLQRGSRVVPLTFRQVYKLKAEGIAFRFLPDPIQVKNAIQIRSSKSFLGVPVFQSDILVLERERQRVSPLYLRKEDLENDLEKVLRKKSRVSHAASAIMVGSLEDVLKEMEQSEPTSVWKDIIFIPPGRSSTENVFRSWSRY